MTIKANALIIQWLVCLYLRNKLQMLQNMSCNLYRNDSERAHNLRHTNQLCLLVVIPKKSRL